MTTFVIEYANPRTCGMVFVDAASVQEALAKYEAEEIHGSYNVRRNCYPDDCYARAHQLTGELTDDSGMVTGPLYKGQHHRVPGRTQ